MQGSFWDNYLKFFLMGFGLFLLGIIILMLIGAGVILVGGGNPGFLLGTIWSWCFTIPGMWVIGRFILKKR